MTKDIRDKYIVPPITTDFAIMFLPTEGLYAEILRLPMVAEKCQNEYHILLAGPTTITALINSFSVGRLLGNRIEFYICLVKVN